MQQHIVRSGATAILGFSWVVVALGCERTRDAPLTAVRDSAGIEIVENEIPDHQSTAEWRVSSGPIVRLGTGQGSDSLQFALIGGVTRLRNGTIVVLDRMTAELHFVDPTGKQLRQAGGRGDGPGEFRAPRTLVRLLGDTLAVYDAQRRAVELFSAEGQPIARRSVIDRQLFPNVTWAPSCLTDLPILWGGEVLRCLPADSLDDRQQIAPTEGLHRKAYRLAAISADRTRVDTLGIYRRGGYYILDLGGGSIRDGGHPFLADSYVAVAVEPGFFFVGANPEYSIEVWNRDGQLQRIIRRPDARREPTAAETVKAWEVALEGVPENLHGRIRSLLSDITLLPAIHGLATGPEGELWVKREPAAGLGGPAVFDVFNRSGRYTGEIALSQDLTLVEVGADYLLGYVLDEFDVPFVELFSLSRSDGSSTEE